MATSCCSIGPPVTDLRQRSSSLHSLHNRSSVCKAQNTLPDAQGVRFMLTTVQPPYLADIGLCQGLHIATVLVMMHCLSGCTVIVALLVMLLCHALSS